MDARSNTDLDSFAGPFSVMQPNAAPPATPSDAELAARLLQLELAQEALLGHLLRRLGARPVDDRQPIDAATVERLRLQDRQHVELLRAAITRFGGDPVDAAVVHFGGHDPAELIERVARIKRETIAVYAAAVPTIADPTFRALVVGMLSIEARHGARLRERAGHSLAATTDRLAA